MKNLLISATVLLLLWILYSLLNMSPITYAEVQTEEKPLTVYESLSGAYSVSNTGISFEVEQKLIEVIPPKKKTITQKVITENGVGVSFLNRSNTHYSRKEEMEAQKVFSTWEVQELIRKYARQYGVDEDLALRIAGSESGYRYGAKNKISTAGGVFQQLLKYWDARANKYGHPGASRFDAVANIEVSIQMLKYEGTSHWNESSKGRRR